MNRSWLALLLAACTGASTVGVDVGGVGVDVGVDVAPDMVGECGEAMSSRCYVDGDGLCVDPSAVVPRTLDTEAVQDMRDAGATDCVARVIVTCANGSVVVWSAGDAQVVAYDGDGTWRGELATSSDGAFGPVCGDMAYLGDPDVLACVLAASSRSANVPTPCDGGTSCAAGECLLEIDRSSAM
ncbi:MAG: hypothetical protein H6733_15285 [Alphaproteobacteria bacterium]|nr:hypothetical protein [Alphaproteobacteria bacterium]